MALDIISNRTYESWEDYDIESDNSAEENALNNTYFDTELSIDEIDEKIQNSVKYINYPNLYNHLQMVLF